MEAFLLVNNLFKAYILDELMIYEAVHSNWQLCTTNDYYSAYYDKCCNSALT